MTKTYPTLNMSATDALKLNQYQRAKHDPATGLVWIEDGTAGVAHSAHLNVEANRVTRKMREYKGWIECRGFLYSPNTLPSTALDRIAARYCQCSPCQIARKAEA